MISPIELILSRLEKVRKGQNGQWMAICPSHNDKTPSLSIRETPEGAVLIKCFAQCTSQEIIESIGLEMSNLFPPRTLSGNEPKKIPKILTASQALELIYYEATFIAVIGNNLANTVSITKDDLERCNKAVGRISWIKSQYMGETI